MIWRDHVLNFGSKSATRIKKFRKKNWRAPRQFFFEILSPSEPILRAKIENMISPDYVLCYIPRLVAILGKEWKFCNLLIK